MIRFEGFQKFISLFIHFFINLYLFVYFESNRLIVFTDISNIETTLSDSIYMARFYFILSRDFESYTRGILFYLISFNFLLIYFILFDLIFS